MDEGNQFSDPGPEQLLLPVGGREPVFLRGSAER